MTHPPNKRRTGNETADRVFRAGRNEKKTGPTTRDSPLGRRLAKMRERKRGPDQEG